ncbi:MAG: Gfo/Idh/MocA family oxidoreductase [Planctomycetes bacterium]|nr:Gfo/Idh/MocA family oxidoreductase [Planctomycetota bacterium]
MRDARMTRRRALQGALLALAAPYVVPASARGADGRPAPSERIGLASIGLGGRGTVNLRTFLDYAEVQVVALCDVDAGSDRYEDAWVRGLAQACETVQKHYGARAASGGFKGVFATQDFRDVLARTDVDAVCISTPDHWHAPIAVMAARAGKDVYCEKPLSLTAADGRAMAEAARRYGRVFQCGSQRRASAKCRRSCELVRNGRIGKLQTVSVRLMGGHWIRKNARPTHEPEPVPDGFDYDMWLGPAPWAPYTYNRCHWNFRWNLDYSGGNVTDWGAHYLDMAHWGMGAELTGPAEVEGQGTWPSPGDLWNAATSFKFECTYADGLKLIVASGGGGVRFEGADGWVDLEGGTSPPGLAGAPVGPDEVRLYETASIHGNFLECIRTRGPTAAPAEVAHRSITVAHLGNIAMQVGRRIRWDPEREEIMGDAEAARLLSRPKRAPWRL